MVAEQVPPTIKVISSKPVRACKWRAFEAVLTQVQNLSQTSQHQNQLMLQQQEANQTLMKAVLNMMQQLGAAVTAAVAKPKNLVDTRALGKPKDFTGKENEWPEWKLKTVSWLNATNTENGLNVEHWLRWASHFGSSHFGSRFSW